MISRLRPTVGRALSETPARLLARIHATPNALTVFGLVVSIGTAWVIAVGELFIAGFLVLFSAWFDMLDGALARLTGKQSQFGAFLDSSVDRLCEAALFLGLIIHYSEGGDTLEVALSYAAIIGSLMVSYTRARAEAVGLKGEIGLLARPERIVLLTLGLFLSGVTTTVLVVVLWIIAVGANLTALRRIIYVWQQTR